MLNPVEGQIFALGKKPFVAAGRALNRVSEEELKAALRQADAKLAVGGKVVFQGPLKRVLRAYSEMGAMERQWRLGWYLHNAAKESFI